MIPQQWTPPCNKQCTNKFSALTQIPWRVFCKKACDADGDTWEECLEECEEMCYKGPVLKDQQWSAYIDRAPGSATQSEDCHRACVAGCGFKFDIPSEKVNKIQSSRSSKPLVEEEPTDKHKTTA
ncbi:PREDICTED: uncharacterized protein LOC109222713 [Nicotiana attenuata]|uniref:uncharacterized protein LOC109222713 n=1 Tax=Nicotiana attenuata TaxID=49451 RepID=UPI000904D973|nr:PREDICTED: uncharacterized protein LOC109222713 [Nicotiana attenuata]